MRTSRRRRSRARACLPPRRCTEACSTPGWSGLQGTGHGRDTILIGNLDARGQAAPAAGSHPQGLPGNFAATKPLQFIRTLYCVSATYKELRGGAAGLVGCPTNAAGSRAFRAANPALFNASGFATHPYPVNLPPTVASSTDPDYTEFSELPRLAQHARPDPAGVRVGQAVPDLQQRVRLHHQPAESRTDGAEPDQQIRLANDRGLLHQLGRIHLLAQPAHRLDDAVPAV